MPIKEELKIKAQEIGFSDIGFAKLDLLSKEIQNYNNWIENKFNATMDYLERNIDKREDITLLLDSAKTIIVTATNYYQETPHSNSAQKGKIARYALSEDYHIIVKNMQEKLIDYLKTKYQTANFKNYVDTGAILERQWAVRAGLGWQGKNGNIISKNIGSWFFIGIIITDIEFENDSNIRDYCGTCTKCIEECPTNAIINPKVIDANKCISYWTIEAKSHIDIPDEINNANPNWVFGCDICQEVCPWNKKFQQTTTIKEFLTNNGEFEIDLNKIINMSKDEYNLRFKNSAMKRAKLEGLQRNAKSLLKKQNKL